MADGGRVYDIEVERWIDELAASAPPRLPRPFPDERYAVIVEQDLEAVLRAPPVAPPPVPRRAPPRPKPRHRFARNLAAAALGAGLVGGGASAVAYHAGQAALQTARGVGHAGIG